MEINIEMHTTDSQIMSLDMVEALHRLSTVLGFLNMPDH